MAAVKYLVVVTLAFSGEVHGVVEYTITDLGALGGLRSEAFDVNNSGIVVGHYMPNNNTGRAFRYINGNMEDLGDIPDFPGNSNSDAYAINDAGEVVGNYQGRAFLWTEGIGMQDILGVPSRGHGINAAGQVVGESSGSAFLWDNGVVTDLGVPTGGDTSWGEDISDSGQILGSLNGGGIFFFWENNEMTALSGSYPSSPSLAVNNKDEFVVSSSLWRRVSGGGWTVTLLSGDAFGINDRSQVVGWMGETQNRSAYVWMVGAGTRNLNDLTWISQIDSAVGRTVMCLAA